MLKFSTALDKIAKAFKFHYVASEEFSDAEIINLSVR